MKYQIHDGEVFEAESAKDVVDWLIATEWQDHHETRQGFLKSMAERVCQQVGSTVPVESEEAFVAGLIAAGLIKVKP